jgi:hypothetical protein
VVGSSTHSAKPEEQVLSKRGKVGVQEGSRLRGGVDMQRIVWYAVVALILITVPLLVSCGDREGPSKEEPARVEEIPGSAFKRVILTEKAAERIGLETVSVREELMARTMTVGGQVLLAGNSSANPDGDSGSLGLGGVVLRVPVSEADLNRVDRSQPAYVLPLGGEADAPGMIAQPIDMANPGSSEEGTSGQAQPHIGWEDGALYYRTDGDDLGLVPGQGVFVELAMSSGEAQRKIVPYAAVLYGVNGETWVYGNPEPLVFVRLPITVDYVDGDLAVLLEGPEVGTPVVTLGAAELFGTETGVSK